jgi:hypothetical protein
MGRKKYFARDYIGRAFGCLTVLEHIGTKPNGADIVRARCYNPDDRLQKCVGSWEGPLYVLGPGKTTSCGCVRDNAKYLSAFCYQKNGLSDRDQAVRGRIGTIKASARAEGHVWSLTDADAERLIFSKCTYASLGGCGSKQQRTKASRETRGLFVLRNGIDRIDSQRGYTLDNCVPCCHIHNTLKRDHTPATAQAFADIIKQVWVAAEAGTLSQYLVPDPSLGVVSATPAPVPQQPSPTRTEAQSWAGDCKSKVDYATGKKTDMYGNVWDLTQIVCNSEDRSSSTAGTKFEPISLDQAERRLNGNDDDEPVLH